MEKMEQNMNKMQQSINELAEISAGQIEELIAFLKKCEKRDKKIENVPNNYKDQ